MLVFGGKQPFQLLKFVLPSLRDSDVQPASMPPHNASTRLRREFSLYFHLASRREELAFLVMAGDKLEEQFLQIMLALLIA